MRTEEEQVQALKDWWKENGRSLMIGVAAALAIVMGWKAWQQNQQRNAETASLLYQNMVDAVVGVVSEDDAASLSTARHLGEQLKADFENEAYARFAAMLLARVAVDQGELDRALSELDWVLAHEPDSEQAELASLRKARILSAQGKTDEALALLATLQNSAFEVQVAEARGDLLFKNGDRDGAREAYQQASDRAAGTQQPLLRMKLADLTAEDQ
ncbi:MAG: tetratricopeptide repeat protein [Marinobacterium sp.]|nr:tetratricopeptide repeat protein [Marinobacterium sp.]